MDGHLRPTLLGRIAGVDLKTSCFFCPKANKNDNPFPAQRLVSVFSYRETIQLVQMIDIRDITVIFVHQLQQQWHQ